MLQDPLPVIQAYFRTHRLRQETEHLALLDPHVRYFGAVSGIRSEGLASYRGVFRGIAQQFRLNEAYPRRILGQWPEYLVFVELHFQPTDEAMRSLEGVWRFVFNEAGLIQELGIFWAPQGPTPLALE